MTDKSVQFFLRVVWCLSDSPVRDEYNWTFRTDLELKGTKIASKSLIGQQMRQENRFEATKSDFGLAGKL